ncbi:hypothetical protein GW932_04320 [archaeon]|nr:hypothetical protein [archaeon]
MKDLSSIQITPGILYHASELVTTYLIPLEKEGKVEISQKFFDKEILPIPFDKIFIGKANYKEGTQINIIDAKTIKNYNTYFNIFKQKENRDLFFKFDELAFFKKNK